MKSPAQSKLFKGFTLIELLIVIGILAILLAITLVALNPAKQFAQSNNTKRRSDVNAILNAIHQYSADHKGLLTGLGIPTEAVAGAGCADANTANVADTGVDLCTAIVPEYMAALPVDPQTNNGAPVTDCTVAYDTGYTVISSVSNQRITVCAPDAELNEAISVTR
jgi:type IV pilus assembly protein PilA